MVSLRGSGFRWRNLHTRMSIVPTGLATPPFRFSRHFAALRAGLVTIAPPALGRPPSHEWVPDATYRPQVTQSLCAYVDRRSGTCDSAFRFPALRCAACRANDNRASGARAAAIARVGGGCHPSPPQVTQSGCVWVNRPSGTCDSAFSFFPALRCAACRANDNRASGARGCPAELTTAAAPRLKNARIRNGVWRAARDRCRARAGGQAPL